MMVLLTPALYTSRLVPKNFLLGTNNSLPVSMSLTTMVENKSKPVQANVKNRKNSNKTHMQKQCSDPQTLNHR
ncbi:MAG: hypothetical protein ACI8PB_000059 [Desulforhopalus sp.]|jgi:hypothetical protein